MVNRESVPSSISKPATPVVPLVCLSVVILLLSSVTLVIKYVYQHSSLQPIGLASVRVTIGFVFLFAITLLWDRRGLLSLDRADLLRLGLVGFLGVFSYAIAAWGLMYTSVIHYAFIYGLLPSCTATLSVLFGKDRMNVTKCAGIVCSLIGCLVAVYQGPMSAASIQFGDFFVLLFTVMMSAHIVFSSDIVKRFGTMVSNTVMFGSSAFLLLLGSLEWPGPPGDPLSPLITTSVLYIGCATAAVFLLRYRSLQSLSPATVGTYHNLIPVCTILLAYLCLDEPVGAKTILGGIMVVVGAEVVRRAQVLSFWSLRDWVKSALPVVGNTKPIP
jgi:drug/metabolite transporter (DMT)-like permease